MTQREAEDSFSIAFSYWSLVSWPQHFQAVWEDPGRWAEKQGFNRSLPTTGDKMMGFSSHSCKQWPCIQWSKGRHPKLDYFQHTSEEGMLFSLYSRQEDKAI